jgi:hypothetical protein
MTKNHAKIKGNNTMNNSKKRYFYLILMALVCVFVYFSNNYYKKIEKEKSLQYTEISQLTKENQRLVKINNDLNIKINEVKTKDIEIIEEKQAKGASKKITRIKQNDSKNNQLSNKTNIEDQSKNKEIKEDQVKVVEKEKEKIEEKKTNYIVPLLIVGSVVLCFGTGICVF